MSRDSARRGPPNWIALVAVLAAAAAARAYVVFGESRRFAWQASPMVVSPEPWQVTGVWLLMAAAALAAGCIGRRLNAFAAAGAGAMATLVAAGLLWGPGHWIHLHSLGALLWGLFWGAAAARMTARLATVLAGSTAAGVLVGYLAPTAIFNSIAIAWLDAVLAVGVGVGLAASFVARCRRDSGGGLLRRLAGASALALLQLVCLLLGFWFGFSIDATQRLSRLQERRDSDDAELRRYVDAPWKVVRNIRYFSDDPWLAALAVARGSTVCESVTLRKEGQLNALLAFPEVNTVSVQGPDVNVRRLSAFQNLQYLRLEDAACRDEDLAFLADLSALPNLHLRRCDLTGEFFEYLAPAPASGAGLLARKTIYYLDIADCPLSAESLANFPQVSLQVLRIQVPNARRVSLANATVRQLTLGGDLTDDDLAEIALAEGPHRARSLWEPDPRTGAAAPSAYPRPVVGTERGRKLTTKRSPSSRFRPRRRSGSRCATRRFKVPVSPRWRPSLSTDSILGGSPSSRKTWRRWRTKKQAAAIRWRLFSPRSRATPSGITKA